MFCETDGIHCSRILSVNPTVMCPNKAMPQKYVWGFQDYFEHSLCVECIVLLEDIFIHKTNMIVLQP